MLGRVLNSLRVRVLKSISIDAELKRTWRYEKLRKLPVEAEDTCLNCTKAVPVSKSKMKATNTDKTSELFYLEQPGG
ncbi:uncharacterized protein ARMOST_18044 [Armillaria ostoyae]|uniref:Uncharacterized protein n=1 Tax=Armillaria ostoyae TaxID=47428 RepID=A0A284S0N8_ARMOS|nr:uncharacterized protein ARMOST_18044 [Armillaria ostoyae]